MTKRGPDGTSGLRFCRSCLVAPTPRAESQSDSKKGVGDRRVSSAYPDSPPRQKVFCLGLLSLRRRFPPRWTDRKDDCYDEGQRWPGTQKRGVDAQ
jgi:hypothetical protein